MTSKNFTDTICKLLLLVLVVLTMAACTSKKNHVPHVKTKWIPITEKEGLMCRHEPKRKIDGLGLVIHAYHKCIRYLITEDGFEILPL